MGHLSRGEAAEEGVACTDHGSCYLAYAPEPEADVHRDGSKQREGGEEKEGGKLVGR